MSDISKFYEDSFPKSKGIVEWWGGYPKEEVSENEYKYSVEILPTISLEDINQYFNHYVKAENQIIELKGPSNIINLPIYCRI